MLHPFDPGDVREPFLSLAADDPEADVCPPGQFRIEWARSFTGGGSTARRASSRSARTRRSA